MIKVERRIPSGHLKGIDKINGGRTAEKICRHKSLISKPARTIPWSYESERTRKASKLLCEPTSYFAKSRNFAESTEYSLAGPPREIKRENKMNRRLNISKCTSCLKDFTVALDCEMVNCMGENGGTFPSLARCSIVDYTNTVLLDLYVKQTRKVVDYCYPYSGITKQKLQEKSCVSLAEAQELVKETINGKLLVGHSIINDFKVLGFTHPNVFTVDLNSSSLRSMLKSLPTAGRKTGLRSLAYDHLNMIIQKTTHCSVEDSIATMEVFKCVEHLWIPKNEVLVEYLSTKHKSYLDDQFWPADMDNV